MRHFFDLFRHELRTLFLSPATYIAGILFLSFMGFLYIFLLEGYSEAPKEDLPSTEFFKVFWMPVFFVVPLLTMKSIAEERRMGTLETLLVTPVSSFVVVLSKFCSAYVFYLSLWALTFGFPLAVDTLLTGGDIQANLWDKASVLGGYGFIALSGLAYISIGIFASSVTRSQFIAGMLTFGLLFVILVGGRLMLEVPFIQSSWTRWAHVPVEYLQTFDHLEDFSRGILDTRPFVFYISTCILMLGLTTQVVEAKV